MIAIVFNILLAAAISFFADDTMIHQALLFLTVCGFSFANQWISQKAFINICIATVTVLVAFNIPLVNKYVYLSDWARENIAYNKKKYMSDIYEKCTELNNEFSPKNQITTLQDRWPGYNRKWHDFRHNDYSFIIPFRNYTDDLIVGDTVCEIQVISPIPYYTFSEVYEYGEFYHCDDLQGLPKHCSKRLE